MGGGISSARPTATESATERPVKSSLAVNGLEYGDVVIINGEAYAGSYKFFVIDFCCGDDIVFHFKVILLENEGSFNKVKMNSRTDGTWGTEDYQENLIYLNHHFELKFICLEDKFSIQVDGNHMCEFNHRVPPGKIEGIYCDGDAVWKDIHVAARGKIDEVDFSDQKFPTAAEVKLFVESLTTNETNPTNAADFSDEDVERLSQIMTDGLEITKKLLGENKSSLMKDIMKYGGYLSKAFSAGSAVFGFIQFVSHYGEPSEMKAVIKKLDAINVQLKELQTTVEKGFADVIEHMDLIQFRDEVKIPVRTMFDLYVRCFTVRGTAPIEDFKKQCKERKSPRDVFSALYEFLDSKKNIFETHLKASKYVYSCYDSWSNALFNYATKLIIMNMFYYGILVKEREATGNQDPLINEQDEIKDLINQIIRMDGRLKEIEDERMKTFHSGGFATEFLLEHYKNVKHGLGEYQKRLPYEILPSIAYQMKNSWKDFNGPTDFQILVVRGATASGRLRYDTRYAKCYIADKEKVSVAENVGHVTERSDDTVSIVLIQPITKESKESNEKAYKEHQDTIKDVATSALTMLKIDPADIIDSIKEGLPKLPFKPLVVLYCSDLGLYDVQLDITLKPFNYDMSSDAWSSPGGPCPSKCFCVHPPPMYTQIPLPQTRREVQILFH